MSITESHPTKVATPRAKLTEDDVRVIRSSTDRDAVLAVRFDVSQMCIWQCRNRLTWKHVE